MSNGSRAAAAVVAAAALGFGAVFAASLQANANPYPPAPTPTATATPTPTPTPSPSPTPTPSPTEAARPNGPLNPPNQATPTPVNQNVELVARDEAVAAPPRFYVQPPTSRAKGAPRADRVVDGQREPIYSVGDVVRLVVQVPPSATYNVQVRIKGGRYSSVGTAVSDSSGQMSLPAMRFSRAGVYTVRMTDTINGSRFFVKISIGA